MLAFVALTLLSVSFTRAEMDADEMNKLMEYYSSRINEYQLNVSPNYDCTEDDIKPNEIKFFLYTRYHPNPVSLTPFSNDKMMSRSYYNVLKQTKFVLPPRLENTDKYSDMVYDYLQTQDVNVVLMDWSRYSRYCSLKSTHDFVVEAAGETLANLMKMLIAYGSNSTSFHLIGFELGADIAGMSAKRMAPNRIGRITALNPTGYEYDLAYKAKIQNADALFVDVIYASTPYIGKREVGDVTLYVNGENYRQPDHSDSIVTSNRKIFKYFKNSITNPSAIFGYKSNSWKDFMEGKFDENKVQMGEYVSQNAKGRFYANSE